MKKIILLLVALLLVSSVLGAEGKLLKNIDKSKMGSVNYNDKHPVFVGVDKEYYSLFEYSGQNYILFYLTPKQGGEYYLLGACGKKVCSIKSEKYYDNVKNSYIDINSLKKKSYKMTADDGTCFYVQAGALGIPIYDCKTDFKMIKAEVLNKIDCGFDKWEEGKTYTLKGNLFLKDEINSFCLNPNKDHVIIDCQGNWIKNLKKVNGLRGISIKDRSDVTVKNCKITGFDYGVVVDNSDYVNLTNNFVADSKYQDYFCQEKALNNRYGTENIFVNVKSCGNWPIAGEHYTFKKDIQLSSCEPKEGWQLGKTYKLTKDLTASDMVGGKDGLPNWVCFNPNVDKVEIDCNGHSVKGKTISSLFKKSKVKTYGVYLDWKKDITLKNCKFEGFSIGIGVHASTGALYKNNVKGNKIGGVVLEGADNKLKVDSNVGSGNGVDFDCGTSTKITGMGNKFDKVKQCPGGWPSVQVTSGEVDWQVIQKVLGMQLSEMKMVELPTFAQALFGDERINVYIILKNKKKISFGAVTEKGKLKGLSQKVLNKPTLNVYTTEETVQEIQNSKEPMKTLEKALEEGKITYKAVTVGNKVKLGLAKIFLKVSGWFN